MPELSIIVPVYKVEKYLPKCIDSILAQTFTDFELILIDDGSPDRCGEICDEYAAKDNRIIVIHQKNAGVSAARNAGLDIAKGTYISFVDSDDVIDPSMYQVMMSTAGRKCQLAYCNVIPFCAKSDIPLISCPSPGIENDISAESLLQDLFSVPSSRTRFIWNKLYQKSYINSARFPVGVSMWEDLAFLVSVFKTQSVIYCAYINAPLYHYRTHETSATLASGSYSFKSRSKLFRTTIFDQLPETDQSIRRYAISFFIDASLRHLSKCRNDPNTKHITDVFRVKMALFYWLFYCSTHHLMSRTLRHRCIREGLLG